jgi:hypothetical protein
VQPRCLENTCSQKGVISGKVFFVRAARLSIPCLRMQFQPQFLLHVGVLGHPEYVPCHGMGCNVQVGEQ